MDDPPDIPVVPAPETRRRGGTGWRRVAVPSCVYINVKCSDEAYRGERRHPMRDRDDDSIRAARDTAYRADARHSLRAHVERRRERHAEAREDDLVGRRVRPRIR